VMPIRADTEKLREDLPRLMQEGLPHVKASNLRPDATLRHYGLKADVAEERGGGHYWIVAGGDVVLFASSDVPAGEGGAWSPVFAEIMAGLEITRADNLLQIQVINEALEQFRQRHPEQDFACDGNVIRGRQQTVFLSNLLQEVRAAPARRSDIIRHFVDGWS